MGRQWSNIGAPNDHLQPASLRDPCCHRPIPPLLPDTAARYTMLHCPVGRKSHVILCECPTLLRPTYSSRAVCTTTLRSTPADVERVLDWCLSCCLDERSKKKGAVGVGMDYYRSYIRSSLGAISTAQIAKRLKGASSAHRDQPDSTFTRPEVATVASTKVMPIGKAVRILHTRKCPQLRPREIFHSGCPLWSI